MAALATPQLSVLDERPPAERLPPGTIGVRRSLEDVNVRMFGNYAMFAAKMTERADGGVPASVAFVSQMWTRRDGAWRLTDVRIASASAVNRTLRE